MRLYVCICTLLVYSSKPHCYRIVTKHVVCGFKFHPKKRIFWRRFTMLWHRYCALMFDSCILKKSHVQFWIPKQYQWFKYLFCSQVKFWSLSSKPKLWQTDQCYTPGFSQEMNTCADKCETGNPTERKMKTKVRGKKPSTVYFEFNVEYCSLPSERGPFLPVCMWAFQVSQIPFPWLPLAAVAATLGTIFLIQCCMYYEEGDQIKYTYNDLELGAIIRQAAMFLLSLLPSQRILDTPSGRAFLTFS